MSSQLCFSAVGHMTRKCSDCVVERREVCICLHRSNSCTWQRSLQFYVCSACAYIYA